MSTRAQRDEANRLWAVWQEALLLKEAHDGTFGSAEAEQKAFDALVEHVEQSGLNSTTYDPR